MSELMLSKIGKSGIEFPIESMSIRLEAQASATEYFTLSKKFIPIDPNLHFGNKNMDLENSFVAVAIRPNHQKFAVFLLINGEQFEKEISVHTESGDIIVWVQNVYPNSETPYYFPKVRLGNNYNLDTELAYVVLSFYSPITKI